LSTGEAEDEMVECFDDIRIRKLSFTGKNFDRSFDGPVTGCLGKGGKEPKPAIM